MLDAPAARRPEEVVGRLLAVQAQDLPSARLALRARGAGPTAADVDRALSDERSLVVAWLGRGTLHLVRREDHGWLLGLTAPGRMAASRRRLGQEGVTPDDAERALRVIARALADDGPLARAELAARVARAGVRADGQAAAHLAMLAGLRGLAVLGPLREGRPVLALTRDWLGEQPPAALGGERREAALAELARRYLAGHGPAGAGDLAAWAGLPLRDARAGLRALDGLDDLGGGLVDLAGRDLPAARPPPRLLPAFDPWLLGWRDRAFAVAPGHARDVHPGGGVLRPVVTVAGVAAGTWSARRSAGRIGIALAPFRPLGAAAARALRAEAADVARFEERALDA
jgi:hypothetical protein